MSKFTKTFRQHMAQVLGILFFAVLTCSSALAQNGVFLRKSDDSQILLSFQKTGEQYVGIFSFISATKLENGINNGDAIVMFGPDEYSNFAFNLAETVCHTRLTDENEDFVIVQTEPLDADFVEAFADFDAVSFHIFKGESPLASFDTDLYYSTHTKENKDYISACAKNPTEFQILVPATDSELKKTASSLDQDGVGTFKGNVSDVAFKGIKFPGKPYGTTAK